MGVKRGADAGQRPSTRYKRKDLKRVKLTRSNEDNHDSSGPSSCSVSEDSALQSSPPASEHGRKSSVSSIQSPVSNDESISSAVASDSDTSSVSSNGEDEEIITIGGPQKPRRIQTDVMKGAQDLRTRLNTFLPELAASNELLSSNGAKLNIEDVGDGEEHIEMNLGLGVLEEKKDDESDSESDTVSEGEDEEDIKDPIIHSSDAVPQPPERRQPDIIRKAFGRSRAPRRPGIEDMG